MCREQRQRSCAGAAAGVFEPCGWAESSLAAQLRIEGKALWRILNHWRPCYTRQAFQQAVKSSCLGELPQDTPVLQSFLKSGEDIYYRFPLLRNWGTPGKTSLLYPCQLGFLGRTLQLLDRKILWFIKIYILNQIKLERSSLCLTCGILRLGEPDSSSSNSSKLRNLCLSLNWISGAAQVTFCSLFIKQESSGLHAPCSQILSVIVCNFWLW